MIVFALFGSVIIGVIAMFVGVYVCMAAFVLGVEMLELGFKALEWLFNEFPDRCDTLFERLTDWFDNLNEL